jgi:hypothetical protein
MLMYSRLSSRNLVEQVVHAREYVHELLKLFSLYPPRKDSEHIPSHPYPPLPKETDPPPQPPDHFTYLRFLGILLYLTKGRPDIMAAVSVAGTKSSSPTDRDLSDPYYVVEYLRATQDMGHILRTSTMTALRLYSASPRQQEPYRLYHLILRDHRHIPQPCVKQTAVATSSTHAEARAIFPLAKELNFLIALCQELQIPLELPAIIMEDNSAVVTMANNDSGYTKKCKHFLMVLNYIKEQIALGQIEARKIYGKLNNADMHTKPLRSSDFAHMAHKILGQPAATPSAHTISPTLPAAEHMSMSDMDVRSQPSTERKRSWLSTETDVSNGVKCRKFSYSACFGFDNGCRCKCACSLVDMQMMYLLGMRRYVPTIDTFTLLPSDTVFGEGAIDTLFAVRV